MNAELYIVPVGMVEQQIVSSVEVYISDLDMIVAPGNSSIVTEEEAKERYADLRKIADIELPASVPLYGDEEITIYEELQQNIVKSSECEELALSKLDSVISEAIEKFKSEPQIHIPTASETSELMGSPDQFLEDSNIILEG